ncbi:MAG TPA: M56 family metallopeptidase [Isosphaeraceae bacterium]|nr:M56 family metallopeptidase [Isosphaeraceae bacterium]
MSIFGLLDGVDVDRIGALLFDATLSTTLFASLVTLAMLGCRQPARRILIARVALLASLAMIPLVALAPLPRLDLVDVLVDSQLVAIPVFISPGPVALKAAAPAGDPEAASWDRPAPDRWPESWAWVGTLVRRGLLFLDLAGIGAGLAWLLLGFGGVQWLIRRARAPSPAAQALFEQLITGGSPAAARTALRVSDRLQHPVVVGMVRPRILIPTSLDQPDGDAEALRLSLLHEIAHVERSDHWFGTVASLAQSVWFFLPQIWGLRSQLVMDQEFLADCSAAQRYGSSFGYASSLLSMAARPGGPVHSRSAAPGASGPATGTVGIASPLFQRVLMLVHCPFPIEVRAPHLWSWTSKLAVVVAAIMAACLFLRWPDAAAVEQGMTAQTQPRSQRFAVGQLRAEPQALSPGGRPIPSVLPLALPAQFDLQVEARATARELAQIRIAGHALGNPDRSPAQPDQVDSWHRVHLSRRRPGVGVRLEIDGEPVPVDSQAEPTSDWFTIETGLPHATELRNLVVAW